MNAKWLVRAGLSGLLAAVSLAVSAAPPPRIAVTDLAYEARQ